MSNQKVYDMKFNKIYSLYLAKIEKKSRTQRELNEIITWLTSYSESDIQNFDDAFSMEDFIKNAPKLNENRKLIKGSICSQKISEIKEETMKEIRYLDKLVDELAKGKEMEKILRK